MNLGDELSSLFTGAPVEREAAFSEGLLRSAQTESAISSAREKRATAQAKERENTKVLSLADDLIAADPNMDPAVARTIAAGAGAGLGNLQQLAGGRNAIESGARLRTIANPMADPNAVVAARAAEAPGSYQQQRVQGNMLIDDATHEVTPTAVGDAQIKNYAETGVKGPGVIAKVINGVGYDAYGNVVGDLGAYTDNAATVAGAQAGARTMGAGTAKVALAKPAAQSAVRAMNTKMDTVDESLDRLSNNDSLWQGVGLAQSLGSIKGTPGATIRAELASLKSQLGVLSLQDMRNASKTGGAVGQVTEKEWGYLASLYGALDENMSVGAFRDAAARVKEVLGRTRRDLNAAYYDQYEAPQPGMAPPGGPAAPAAAAPVEAPPVAVSSAAEALRLPPGTVFITPDGRRKVR